MEFLELARKRYSVRKYKPERVPEEDLNYILEAGRIAPSAVNYQPWRFIVVSEKENREKINDLYARSWFRSAPVVIIILADHSLSWKRSDGKDHADIDAAITTDHMTLAAAEKGLGTCWICNFDKEATMKMFNLPANLEPVVILPLGYPDDTPDTGRHYNRKAMNEILSFEKLI
ncbi:MAG: nitroreductase family protein [Bacteroidales bacterium]|nr:nitroreductase family protein [Bacteroidales bacterium]